MRFRILLVFGFVILGCIGLTAQIIRLNKVKGDNYTKRMLAQQSHTMRSRISAGILWIRMATSWQQA